MKSRTTDEAMEDPVEPFAKPGYSAPALEKGLDIIELLSASDIPLTTRSIAEQLGRSKSEIFRMVYVLVDRGYLLRDPVTDQLGLSNRLFELGIRTPRPRKLLEVAVPVVERLSNRIGHSAHLVVVSGGETIVIAAATGDAETSFNLRLGYRRPALDAASGRAIIAFQTPEVRTRMIADSQRVSRGLADAVALSALLDSIRDAGYLVVDSLVFVGITDVCTPILARNGTALASIVVPCLRRIGSDDGLDGVVRHLIAASREISEGLL